MDEIIEQIQTLLKEIGQLGSGNSFIEKLLKEKIKEFEELTGIDTNDLLPKTTQIIEGCSLVIINSGIVTFETKDGKKKTIPFYMNNTPIQHIKVPKVCSGTISITSLWIYKQDAAIEITDEDFRGKNFIDKATKEFKLTNQFEVNSNGDIQIFKGDITRTIDNLKGEISSYFLLREIEVDLEKNDNTMSIGGGVYENKKSPIPEYIKRLYLQRNFSKDIATYFSLVLELQKEEKKPLQKKEKELIFENENQAILSSDQKSVCLEWWKKLRPNTKENIRNKKVKVVIQGFASPPGTNEYNNQLGLDRAKNVATLLTPKIGTDLNGEPLCIFNLIGEGEATNDPRRYVKITIVKI
jgi:hypothetical protein